MEEDPEIVNAPLHDESDPCEAEHSDSEPSSEEEDDWNTKKSLESIKDALRNDKILDLGDPSQEQQFLGRYGSFLGETTSDNDRNTLLHLIVEDAKDKVFGKYEPLVRLLISRHPGLAVVKDGNEKTALYIAISRKRDKLAHFICDNHPNVDQILNVPCYHSQNCLHLAVHRNIKLAGFLIERASEETLCAKDDQGRTPLHLAVDYTRCTVKQLEVVKALIQRGDKALDERTNAPHCLSAYRYHEHTHKDTERDEKSKEKDKSKWMEVKDEGGVHRKPEAAHKEDAGMKLIPPPQAGDARNVKPPSMVTRPPGNAPFDLETRKIDPPRRTNSILKPPGQPSGPSSSSGALKSSGGIKAMSNVESLVGNGKLGTIKKTRKKREKVESEVTKESADDVMSYLKLHCLRTRSHDAASDFLYGPNPENQIYFDLYDYNALTIREDHLKRSLDYLKLEDTLQYVFLANIKIEKPTPHKQG
ncbi:MAG: hypothetical protein M1833_005503, partial [Piccolia ochrophora]